jgi:tetratricopeptide (TPR) repeat protein
MNRRFLWVGAVALIALTVAVHWPALHNGFIWDDDDHFTANPAVAAPDGLRKIWSSLEFSRYYPLTLTTFWAQRRLWGLNPMPYHAVNIAFHATNAVLIFLLLRRLNVRAAWAAAAIWAAHPVTVESVAWVTELKNTQSGVFFFLSLLCFLEFERRRSVAGGCSSRRLGGKNNHAPVDGRYYTTLYAFALITFAAAVLSKPSAVVLPLVILLCAWWRRRKLTRADLVRALPFFALAAGMSLLTIVEQGGHIERGVQDGTLGLTERFIVAGKATWFYAWKTVWPADLIFVYPRWKLDADSVVSLFPLAGVAAVGIALWRFRQREWARASLFGFGYFLIALLPVLGFFDIYFFRYSFVADHFQYLACLGIIALAAAGGNALIQHHATRIIAALTVMAGLGAMSWHHSHIFRDDETLWRDTLAKNPSAFIAHNNLGVIYNGKRDYARAEKHFREALRLKPDFLEARSNLGLALTELGGHEEALEELQTALRIKPDFSKAHYCLGRLYYIMKKFAAAEHHLRLATLSEPTMAEAHYDLGVLLQEQGEDERAIASYTTAISLRPDYAAAHNNLANIHVKNGNFHEAIRHYTLAIEHNPSLGEAHYNVAAALRETGRTELAIHHARKAVELRPKLGSGYFQLGKLLAETRQYSEAIQVFRRGLEVEPWHMLMGNEMAWIMATAPDPAARNAPQAIQIGERLAELTHRKEPKPLDMLAAAYAEAGRFQEAVATAREAHAIAVARNLSELAAQIQRRIELYEQRQPYRLNSP